MLEQEFWAVKIQPEIKPFESGQAVVTLVAKSETEARTKQQEIVDMLRESLYTSEDGAHVSKRLDEWNTASFEPIKIGDKILIRIPFDKTTETIRFDPEDEKVKSLLIR